MKQCVKQLTHIQYIQHTHLHTHTHSHTLTLGLFVAVVEHYISGVIDACSQILHCASAEFVDTEHKVVDVGNAIDVVLEDINAEWVE